VDNPFERYDLDPREGIVAITARLKELIEDAHDDEERKRLRDAWEELTRHPAQRLRAAVFTHPETRSPFGRATTSTRALEIPAGAVRADDVPTLDDDPLLAG
jgi:hypothetical protein